MSNFFDNLIEDEPAKKQIIDSNLKKFRDTMPYKMEVTNSVNLLFVGKGRSGKTSFKKLLKDPTSKSVDLSLYAGTIEARLKNYILSECGTKKVINIIDTPGLFEARENEEDVRSNSNLRNLIKLCVEKEITNFHCICFFVSCPKGIDREDIKAILEFKNFFGDGICTNAMLILTRCERHSDIYLESLKKQLFTDPQLSQISEYFSLGVCYSGLIDHNDYACANDQAVYRQLKRVSEFRKTFLDKVMEIEKPFMVNETNFSEMKKMQKEIDMLLEEMEKKDKEICELVENLNSKKVTTEELNKKLNKIIREKEEIKKKKNNVQKQSGVSFLKSIFTGNFN